jgi:hypothetical protein
MSIPTLNLRTGITLCYITFSQLMTGCVYKSTADDNAVASLNSTVQDAMEQAITHRITKKSKFLHWFSSSL